MSQRRTSRYYSTLLAIASLTLLTGFYPTTPLGILPAFAATQTTSPDSESWAFLSLINTFRAQNGAGPLEMSSTLTNSATWLSSDMATKNYFSHTDSLGRDLKTRLTSFGYTGSSIAENIAAGQSSAQDVFTAWQNSPGHRVNMLNPTYRVIGVGRVVQPGSPYTTYWTTDFGDSVTDVMTPTPSLITPTSPSPTSTPTSVSTLIPSPGVSKVTTTNTWLANWLARLKH